MPYNISFKNFEYVDSVGFGQKREQIYLKK